MQLFNTPPSKSNSEIVFNLLEFDKGLYLPTAFIVKREKGKLTYLQSKAFQKNLEGYGLELTDLRKKLLEIVEKLQVPNLEKKFSPPRRKVQKLGKLLETRDVRISIEKYVHRELDILFKLVVEHDLPLCWGIERKVQVDDIRIRFPKVKLEPQLFFNKTTTGVAYQLKMKTGKRTWKIQQKDVIPITNIPGWLFVDYHLFKLDSINGNMVKPFQKKPEILIPQKSVKTYFQSFILKQAAKLDIETKGFEVVKYETLEGCELELMKDIFSGDLGLSMRFVYENSFFQWNDPKQKRTKLDFGENSDEVEIQQIIRDGKSEQKFIKKLENFGFRKNKGNLFQLAENEEDKYRLIEWLQEKLGLLKASGFLLKNIEIGEKKILLEKPSFQKRIAKGNDWFDVFIEIVVGEFRIPFYKFINHIREKDRFYELPNGEFFLIPKEWMRKFQGLVQFGKKSGEALRLAKTQFAILKDFDSEKEENDKDFDWQNIDFKPSKNLKATLRPYQLEGAKWLVSHYQNEMGACLADDMGLGKTLQTITVLLHAKEQKGRRGEEVQNAGLQVDMFQDSNDLKFLKPLNALIILPASLVFNWENEIKKFAPSLSTYRHIGTKRHKDVQLLVRNDVLLTTYQTALKDVDILQKMEFEYVVLDESQYIKNKNSKVFKAINKLNAKHRISLSGTPIENSLSDLWSQMQFINPSHLGSANFFQKEFIYPIEKLGDDDKKERLRNLVSPFLMRRTKEEVAKDLPELEVQIFYSEMTAEQKKLYEKEKSKARNALLKNFESGSFKYQSLVLQTLLRLRQIVNHPKLVFEDYEKGSGKFNDILEQWNKIRKSEHKTLMFSSFVKYLELFKTNFQKEEQQFSWLTGGVNTKKRESEIKKFQNEKAVQTFLISTKAGGTGLNLTAADYVFLLDPWWNPAAEKQAIARAHRIGQTKKVIAIKYITKDSIEEKILALQERKSALANDILEGAGKQVFTKGDLQFLLE